MNVQDEAHATDEVDITLERSPFEPERKSYRVVAENGLFKRGQQHDPGQLVELDEKTAAAFLVAGDIEEVPTDEN